MTTALVDRREKNINSGKKYLTFHLGHESYGVDVLAVREIIQMQSITSVPQMPAYVKGVINLRGKIIPVIDLRIKFGMKGNHELQSTCIIVVQIQNAENRNMLMGLVVDGVEEVLNISSQEIEPTPHFGSSSIRVEYIMGMAKVKGQVKTLLDIHEVITRDEFEIVEEIGK
jgi:purine-binding chemotaxis protein CheW